MSDDVSRTRRPEEAKDASGGGHARAQEDPDSARARELFDRVVERAILTSRSHPKQP